MIKNIIISVSKDTRMVYLGKYSLGNDNEDLQANLVFKFVDEFVKGTARLEFEIDGEKKYSMLQRDGESYTIPVRNVLTKEGQHNFQLVITEGTNDSLIPIFKSNIFYMFVGSSINHCPEEPAELYLWIDKANTKLNEIDETIEDVEDRTNKAIEDIQKRMDEVVEDCEEQSQYAKEQGDYAKEQGIYANTQGNYAKEQGDYANEKGQYAFNTTKEIQGMVERGEFDGADFNYNWRGTELGVKNSKETTYQYVDLQGDSGVYVGENEPTNDANVWINPKEPYDNFDAEYVIFTDGEDLQYKFDNNKLVYDDTEIKRKIDDVIDSVADVEDVLHQQISSVEEISNSAYDLANEAEIIARGKSTGHVFETKQEMETWLSDDSHKAILNVGDHLYIKNAEDFDHWWDGQQAQELQTQKVDLSEYYLKEEINEKLKGYALTSSLISAINNCEPKMASSIDYVIETGYYGNGESGYRKYKNGIIEQWGVARTNTSETEFTMHKPHINQNFSIFIEPREQGNFYHYAIPSANQKFKVRIQTRDSLSIAVAFQWRSYGRWN